MWTLTKLAEILIEAASRLKTTKLFYSYSTMMAIEAPAPQTEVCVVVMELFVSSLLLSYSARSKTIVWRKGSILTDTPFTHSIIAFKLPYGQSYFSGKEFLEHSSNFVL
jgi:hypothetical protein